MATRNGIGDFTPYKDLEKSIFSDKTNQGAAISDHLVLLLSLKTSWICCFIPGNENNVEEGSRIYEAFLSYRATPSSHPF